MNRKSIKLLLLAIFALVFLQIGFAAKPTNKTTGKSKTTYSTKKLHYAKVSNCRVLDTLVELINQCKINESWYDWKKYPYIYFNCEYVIPTDTLHRGMLGDSEIISYVTSLSDSDFENMFQGKEVSRDIKIYIFSDNQPLHDVILNYDGFNFVLESDYKSVNPIFKLHKKTFTSKSEGLVFVKQPVITIIYKPSGEIEALPVYTGDFPHF